MRDDTDHAVGIGGEPFQRDGDGLQGVLVQRAESLVEEHGIQIAHPSGEPDDLAGQRKGQRQRCLEGLAAGQGVYRAARTGVLVVDDDQVIAVVPVELVLAAGQFHQRDGSLRDERVKCLAAQPALERTRPQQLTEHGRDLFFFAAGADLVIQLRRPLEALPHGLQLVLGAYRMRGYGGRGACGVGGIGDVVLGQQPGERGGVVGDPLPEGRRGAFQSRLAPGAVLVLRCGPRGQHGPGPGQVGVLDGRCAQRDYRVAGVPQLYPGPLFLPSQGLAALLRFGDLRSPGRRVFACLVERRGGLRDRLQRPSYVLLAGRLGQGGRILVQPLPGPLQGAQRGGSRPRRQGLGIQRAFALLHGGLD